MLQKWRDKRIEAKTLEELKAMASGSWICSKCDDKHTGLFHLAVFGPAAWPGEADYEPNANLCLDGNFLSEDFCVINGENFIVRCVLLLPIHGLEQPLGFGVWSTLSRENFEAHVSEFDPGHTSKGVEWTGWFMNQLPVFGETYATPCWVYPQKNRQRPQVFMQDENSDLGRLQRDGITAQRALDIYRHYGHV
ncbi:hypothetical protein GCM10009069_17310 [Algimonas arctica]|uniref:DUF2199 domain-containing protein n=1 Tax=Algimonas arctica TaxID=1479486 RepID=A0A8J3CSH4_9PROT|nr:DUF2199 domain-containing protein [Algimonas arctica]GHA94849.1 hypothetical protein GCM10009069_17310 [Algimonas arctica]